MRLTSHSSFFVLVLITLFPLSFCSSKLATTYKEDFEGDKKGSYTNEKVKMAGGEWTFEDALIGSTEEDRKSGSQSVRIRNQGRITMNFDLTGGASIVSLKHAIYGGDPGSDFELWFSTDKGRNWKKVEPRISAAPQALKKATFTLNVKEALRLQIRKVTGVKNRINFDDLVVEPFGSATAKAGGKPVIAEKPVATPVPAPDKTAAAPKTNPTAVVPASELYLALGNPSKATPDGKNPDNYLMVKPQYALSYNRSKGIPNWVSWYVDSSWLGKVDRQNDFRPDKVLPAGWYRVTPTDYTGGGFDRGHVCPSADRQNTEENNSATFFMTNMVPQSPDNNQGPWEKLEAYCRRLVEKDIELYIIAGQYGVGGTGSNGPRNDLKGKVTVPAHTWKVVVVLPEGEKDLSRININTRVIAIDIPNVQGIKEDYWTKYSTSVDAIEKATGYDLLSNVPKAVQDALEAKVSK
jgi:endonuclease G, mitochondrial